MHELGRLDVAARFVDCIGWAALAGRIRTTWRSSATRKTRVSILHRAPRTPNVVCALSRSDTLRPPPQQASARRDELLGVSIRRVSVPSSTRTRRAIPASERDAIDRCRRSFFVWSRCGGRRDRRSHTSFFNEFLQQITYGASLSFTLDLTTFGAATPDNFSFYLLDSKQFPFPTSDPTGADSLISINITGPGITPQVYSSDDAIAKVTPAVSMMTPEPGGLWLLGVSLLTVLCRRTKSV